MFEKGNKLSPGRKTAFDEHLRASVINGCWEIVKEVLDGTSKKYKLTAKEELALAIDIVKKSIPQEINLKDDYDNKETIDQRIGELGEEIKRLTDRIGTTEIKEDGDRGEGVETTESTK